MAALAAGQQLPYIERVEPARARAREKLAIIGKHFGADDPGGMGKVWIGRCPSMPGAPGAGTMVLPRSALLSWSDTRIEFIFPPRAFASLAVTSMSGRMTGLFDLDVENACQDAPPKPVIRAVLNAASLQETPLSPGAFITLLGTDLAEDSDLGATRVYVSGAPAEILSVSPHQITFVAPPSLEPGAMTTLSVARGGVESEPFAAASGAAAPAIFMPPFQPAPAGIFNEDGTLNSPAHPAAPGSAISFHASGLAGPDSFTALVSGRAAGIIAFQQARGIALVTLRLPADLTPGDRLPLVLRAGNTETQRGVFVSVAAAPAHQARAER
jgi:uncharacterized protein (TIGR03437 family)